MPAPLFFINEIPLENAEVNLDEGTSKHIIQVLRMNEYEDIRLTDGKGKMATATIVLGHKRAAVVKITNVSVSNRIGGKKCVAISPIKNTSRFEWFLEKITEIGIDEIVLIITHRTEKQNFRLERMQSIISSAMLQSQQSWLPEVYGPVKFEKFILNNVYDHKYIAHCDEGDKSLLKTESFDQSQSRIVLIGPEGDFTNEEITLTKAHGYKPVSLGESRLRTETAGIVAATLIQ